jgi:hypothetical protein
MKSRTLFATALILITPLVVLAFQDKVEQVRRNELKGRSFTSGPLKITLIDFYGGGIAFPRGHIDIVVGNMSDDFTTFDPRRLSFVDKDGDQVDVFGLRGMDGDRELVVAAEDMRIWPKARIKRSYALTNRVPLPARLYYEDKLLATIIE